MRRYVFEMVEIDCWILGYRKIKIPPDKISLVTSLLIRRGIYSRFDSDGNIIIKERDFDKIQGILQGRVEFEYTKVLGLYGSWVKLRHKVAFVCAIAFSVALVFLLSNLVWDVRVEGNFSVPDAKIVYELKQCGLSVGELWGSIDRGEVESLFLKKSEDISWININRRGMVAYITVIEKDESETLPHEKQIYSNIVANRDCVIEEITVSSGVAMVRAGDVVKKGDILIAGVYSLAGGGFCNAEGKVIGRISDTITDEVDRRYENSLITGRRVAQVNINFFKFSLNIFKLYGNLDNEYDIIENEISYSFFGKAKLPFSVTVKYLPEYNLSEGEYTDSQMVALATERLNALTALTLASSDLVRIRTYGRFTEDKYILSSDITFLSDVTEVVEFEID